MIDLAVIVPTRQRPDACRDLVASFDDLCGDDVELVLAVDSDDPTLDEYREIEGVRLFVNDDLGSMNRALNAAAVQVAAEFEFIGFMGDDHRPRTYRWDQYIVAALTGKPGGIVYADDLLQRHRLPTQVFMDSRIVGVLGWMAPPTLRHLYLDNFWKVLGERLGTLQYLPHVIIEHLHPVAGKAEWDDSYKTTNAKSVYLADGRAFVEYVDSSLADDVARVRKVIG